MNNHIYHILEKWLAIRDTTSWVLGIVTNTRGSVYRKTGAMMLIGESGEQFGLVSGGCLESDLRLQARRVFAFNKSRVVEYDSEDEGGLAWQLGIGCGGAAEISLLPCNAENKFLCLEQLFAALTEQRHCLYKVCVATGEANVLEAHGDTAHKNTNQSSPWLCIPLSRPVHLCIFGAGVDMLPVAELSALLGWHTTIVDERIANYAPEKFAKAQKVICEYTENLAPEIHQSIDAAVVANHNVSLDAKAVRWLLDSSAQYVGLLGPSARKQKVLNEAGLREEQLSYSLHGPMGLSIGGELPESIALSVLAQCHKAIFQKPFEFGSTDIAKVHSL